MCPRGPGPGDCQGHSKGPGPQDTGRGLSYGQMGADLRPCPGQKSHVLSPAPPSQGDCLVQVRVTSGPQVWGAAAHSFTLQDRPPLSAWTPERAALKGQPMPLPSLVSPALQLGTLPWGPVLLPHGTRGAPFSISEPLPSRFTPRGPCPAAAGLLGQGSGRAGPGRVSSQECGLWVRICRHFQCLGRRLSETAGPEGRGRPPLAPRPAPQPRPGLQFVEPRFPQDTGGQHIASAPTHLVSRA